MIQRKPKGKKYIAGSAIAVDTAIPSENPQPPRPRRRDIWKAKDILGVGKYSKPTPTVPDEELVQFLNTPKALNVLSIREEKIFRNFVNNNKTREELQTELNVTEIGLYEYMAGLRLKINDVREAIPGVIPKHTPEQLRWMRDDAAARAEDRVDREEALKFQRRLMPTSEQLIEQHEVELIAVCNLLATKWWDQPAIDIRIAIEEAATLMHKLIDRYFISPLDNLPEHIVRYLELKEHIVSKLKILIPNHTCAHGRPWFKNCDMCDEFGVLPINLTDVYAVNSLLSKLGLGKWAGYSKLCSYAGSTTNNGKLIHIDAAIQRERSVGGKRVKPKGNASDDHQTTSAPDPNYAGKRTGPEFAHGAGAPVEGFNMNTPPEPHRELPATDLYDRDPEENSPGIRTPEAPEVIHTGDHREPELPSQEDLMIAERQKRGPRVDADLF